MQTALLRRGPTCTVRMHRREHACPYPMHACPCDRRSKSMSACPCDQSITRPHACIPHAIIALLTWKGGMVDAMPVACGANSHSAFVPVLHS